MLRTPAPLKGALGRTNMPDQEALEARTEAKLRYGAVHLAELDDYGPLDGGDFERAHVEAFLFQLLGAKEAFLNELNCLYKTERADDSVSLGKLRKALEQQGRKSDELRIIYELESESTSWLAQAKSARDSVAHIGPVKRTYHLGGPDHGKVKIRIPVTGELSENHLIDDFKQWLGNMKDLIHNLRASASKSDASHK